MLPLLALCSSCSVVAGVDAAVGGADAAAMGLLFCSSVMWFLCLSARSLVCSLVLFVSCVSLIFCDCLLISALSFG